MNLVNSLFASERCMNETPEPTDRGNGHTVACFLFD